jgi:hypothetical protein
MCRHHCLPVSIFVAGKEIGVWRMAKNEGQGQEEGDLDRKRIRERLTNLLAAALYQVWPMEKDASQRGELGDVKRKRTRTLLTLIAFVLGAGSRFLPVTVLVWLGISIGILVILLWFCRWVFEPFIPPLQEIRNILFDWGRAIAYKIAGCSRLNANKMLALLTVGQVSPKIAHNPGQPEDCDPKCPRKEHCVFGPGVRIYRFLRDEEDSGHVQQYKVNERTDRVVQFTAPGDNAYRLTGHMLMWNYESVFVSMNRGDPALTGKYDMRVEISTPSSGGGGRELKDERYLIRVRFRSWIDGKAEFTYDDCGYECDEYKGWVDDVWGIKNPTPRDAAKCR